ncbi:hypothetical protein GJ496_004455 [Pomphorhynchus laevis]|nr:hypothetical protein GJ496_004455 [Pomphorhynchus laevis]
MISEKISTDYRLTTCIRKSIINDAYFTRRNSITKRTSSSSNLTKHLDVIMPDDYKKKIASLLNESFTTSIPQDSKQNKDDTVGPTIASTYNSDHCTKYESTFKDFRFTVSENSFIRIVTEQTA